MHSILYSSIQNFEKFGSLVLQQWLFFESTSKGTASMEMGHIIQIQANSTVLSVCDQYTQRLLLSISFAHYLWNQSSLNTQHENWIYSSFPAENSCIRTSKWSPASVPLLLSLQYSYDVVKLRDICANWNVAFRGWNSILIFDHRWRVDALTFPILVRTSRLLRLCSYKLLATQPPTLLGPCNFPQLQQIDLKNLRKRSKLVEKSAFDPLPCVTLDRVTCQRYRVGYSTCV